MWQSMRLLNQTSLYWLTKMAIPTTEPTNIDFPQLNETLLHSK